MTGRVKWVCICLLWRLGNAMEWQPWVDGLSSSAFLIQYVSCRRERSVLENVGESLKRQWRSLWTVARRGKCGRPSDVGRPASSAPVPLPTERSAVKNAAGRSGELDRDAYWSQPPWLVAPRAGPSLIWRCGVSGLRVQLIIGFLTADAHIRRLCGPHTTLTNS